jgi:hypothetical protein
MACQHCKADNTENWFYCRTCGKKANPTKFSTQFIVRETPWATAIRKDLINVSETTMGEDIESKGGVVRGNV